MIGFEPNRGRNGSSRCDDGCGCCCLCAVFVDLDPGFVRDKGNEKVSRPIQPGKIGLRSKGIGHAHLSQRIVEVESGLDLEPWQYDSDTLRRHLGKRACKKCVTELLLNLAKAIDLAWQYYQHPQFITSVGQLNRLYFLVLHMPEILNLEHEHGVPRSL